MRIASDIPRGAIVAGIASRSSPVHIPYKSTLPLRKRLSIPLLRQTRWARHWFALTGSDCVTLIESRRGLALAASSLGNHDQNDSRQGGWHDHRTRRRPRRPGHPRGSRDRRTVTLPRARAPAAWRGTPAGVRGLGGGRRGTRHVPRLEQETAEGRPLFRFLIDQSHEGGYTPLQGHRDRLTRSTSHVPPDGPPPVPPRRPRRRRLRRRRPPPRRRAEEGAQTEKGRQVRH